MKGSYEFLSQSVFKVQALNNYAGEGTELFYEQGLLKRLFSGQLIFPGLLFRFAFSY